MKDAAVLFSVELVGLVVPGLLDWRYVVPTPYSVYEGVVAYLYADLGGPFGHLDSDHLHHVGAHDLGLLQLRAPLSCD